jgi:phosphoribosylformylglycinamidine synthase PurS subunit
MGDNYQTSTRVLVTVMLKPGVLDIQGNTVGKALNTLGFTTVQSVRIGKIFELDVPGTDPIEVRARAENMVRRAMVNPVIEDFKIEIDQGPRNQVGI